MELCRGEVYASTELSCWVLESSVEARYVGIRELCRGEVCWVLESSVEARYVGY